MIYVIFKNITKKITWLICWNSYWKTT